MTRIRRRIAPIFGAALLLVVVLAAPGQAVTYGLPDLAHGNVAAIILDFEGSGALQWCTATLVSPRVLLTAGHCTRGLDDLRVPVDVVRVSFAWNVWRDPASWRRVAGWATHPAYRWGPTADPHDLGVVVLDDRETGVSAVRRAPVGYLDELRGHGGLRGEPFDVVGYGQNEHGIVTGDRQVATSLGLSVHSAWLYLSQNVQRGAGGTCTGDSGGPTFHGSTEGELLVAVTSWGDVPCVATGIAYRVDTLSARGFVDAMVTTYG
ncbi:MAG: trypsin-like serine peptidase [Methanobacteriota archaeon]